MSHPVSLQTESDANWYIVRRWQTYVAELRVLILRMVAVVLLYGLQLVHHFVWLDAEAQAAGQAFQYVATGVACWAALLSLGVLLSIMRKWLPPALPYVTTVFDLLMVLTLVVMAGGPGQTETVSLLYLVIVLAGLRFDLKLLWICVPLAMAGYLVSIPLAETIWGESAGQVSLIRHAAVLTTLALVGVTTGQIVRRARQMAEEFHRRMPPGRAAEARS